MQINSPLLLIEINNLEFIFFVVDKIKEEKFQIIHKESIPIKGSLNEKISNQDTIFAKVKPRTPFLPSPPCGLVEKKNVIFLLFVISFVLSPIWWLQGEKTV